MQRQNESPHGHHQADVACHSDAGEALHRTAAGRTTSTTTATSQSWTIIRWTVLHRLAVLLLLLISASLQRDTFDSSPALIVTLDAASSSCITSRCWSQHLIRWDALHFLGIASPRALPAPSVADRDAGGGGGGLAAEHSLAFQPAMPWLLRIAGQRVQWTSGSSSRYMRRSDVDVTWNAVQAILITSLMAMIVSVTLPFLLYRFTLQVVQRPRTAKLAALLSILSTAPATLITPTPEAFFALFALLGHLCLDSASSSSSQRPVRFVLATLRSAVLFGVASAFRANGILLFGFLAWDLLWKTTTQVTLLRNHSLALRALLLVVALAVTVCLATLPQVWAHHRFCQSQTQASLRRPWCTKFIPAVYTFVQAHYWHVGLLHYWTLAQLPNWLLATPILCLTAHWLIDFYSADIAQVVRHTTMPPSFLHRSKATASHDSNPKATAEAKLTMHSAPHLLGHAHYTLSLLAILILASHVQIALRFATPGAMPVLWWSGAALAESWSSTASGGHVVAARKASLRLHIFLAMLVLWNAASVVLYAGFYPPA